MAHIGDKIKERRKQLGMTQTELADKMGYTSKTTISKIEKGINDVTQSTIVKFAEVLKTDVRYLMDWDDKLSTLVDTIEENGYDDRITYYAERIASYNDDELNELENFMDYIESKRR